MVLFKHVLCQFAVLYSPHRVMVVMSSWFSAQPPDPPPSHSAAMARCIHPCSECAQTTPRDSSGTKLVGISMRVNMDCSIFKRHFHNGSNYPVEGCMLKDRPVAVASPLMIQYHAHLTVEQLQSGQNVIHSVKPDSNTCSIQEPVRSFDFTDVHWHWDGFDAGQMEMKLWIVCYGVGWSNGASGAVCEWGLNYPPLASK